MKLPLKITFIASVFVLAGCGTMFNKSLKEKLATRASFEMDCPKEELKYSELSSGGLVTQYGVSGCGNKGVYVLGPHDNWYLNSEGKD